MSDFVNTLSCRGRVPRVVLFSRKLDAGGAERQLVTIARELKKRGYDVHVVLFYHGGVFEPDLTRAGVSLHFLDKRGRWDLFGFLFRLVATLRRIHPDVIYSFLDLPNVLAGFVRKCVGSPRIAWSVRSAGMEMEHYDWLSRLVPWIEGALSKWADVVIANSFAGAAWAAQRGFPTARLQVVENGIDTVQFRPDPEGGRKLRTEWNIGGTEVLVGLVGRLDAMKDHANFLTACAKLATSRQNLRFVLVGSGSEGKQNELRALVNRLGITERMIWAGPRQDMRAVYSALDLSCSSSIAEGFSNTIAESMSCGVPCVVTDVGDSARIVGGLGEVAPPSDAGAFRDAMERMLTRIEGEPRIRIQVRERVIAEFSIDRMVTRTERALFGPA